MGNILIRFLAKTGADDRKSRDDQRRNSDVSDNGGSLLEQGFHTKRSSQSSKAKENDGDNSPAQLHIFNAREKLVKSCTSGTGQSGSTCEDCKCHQNNKKDSQSGKAKFSEYSHNGYGYDTWIAEIWDDCNMAEKSKCDGNHQNHSDDITCNDRFSGFLTAF